MLPKTRRAFLKAGTRAATASRTQAPRADAIDEPDHGKVGALCSDHSTMSTSSYQKDPCLV
jgi:hypothetical protein